MKSKKEQLKKLIEEATVDTYNLDEALAGFAVVIEDNLKFPFRAKVVGEDVEVIGIDQDINVGGGVVAICKRSGKKYKVALPELEISSEVEGKEWIDAYLYWLSGEE